MKNNIIIVGRVWKVSEAGGSREHSTYSGQRSKAHVSEDVWKHRQK